MEGYVHWCQMHTPSNVQHSTLGKRPVMGGYEIPQRVTAFLAHLNDNKPTVLQIRGMPNFKRSIWEKQTAFRKCTCCFIGRPVMSGAGRRDSNPQSFESESKMLSHWHPAARTL